jgi:hypothetical protein
MLGKRLRDMSYNQRLVAARSALAADGLKRIRHGLMLIDAAGPTRFGHYDAGLEDAGLALLQSGRLLRQQARDIARPPLQAKNLRVDSFCGSECRRKFR